MHSIQVLITKEPIDESTFCYRTDSGYYVYDSEVDISKISVDYVIANTNYFGGVGEQEAFYNNNNEYFPNSINEALKKLGVIRADGWDEFDIVGLGKFRSNEGLKQMYNYPKVKETIITQKIVGHIEARNFLKGKDTIMKNLQKKSIFKEDGIEYSIDGKNARQQILETIKKMYTNLLEKGYKPFELKHLIYEITVKQ